jgi:hypothetical protein
MKAILEFDLEEPSDINAHKRAVNSTNVYIALSDFSNFLRTERKYKELTEEQAKYLEYITENFFSVIEDRSIDMNDLE